MKPPVKGLDKLREKLPAFAGKKAVVIPLYVIVVAVVTFNVLSYFDRMPERFPPNDPAGALMPLLGGAVVYTVGGLCAWQMWFWRNYLKRKYGKLSYQKIFFAGLTGITVIICSSFHTFNDLYYAAQNYWSVSPFRTAVLPPELYPLPYAGYAAPAAKIAGIALLVFGILMVYRSLITFGLDYMAVVYLYFPEESELRDLKIYSILRHPTYAALITISLAGAVFRFTPYSFVLFLMTLTFFYIHIKLVEEPELRKRFGEGYGEYIRRTRAFFVKPRDIPTLLKIVFGKDTSDRSGHGGGGTERSETGM